MPFNGFYICLSRFVSARAFHIWFLSIRAPTDSSSANAHADTRKFHNFFITRHVLHIMQINSPYEQGFDEVKCVFPLYRTRTSHAVYRRSIMRFHLFQYSFRAKTLQKSACSNMCRRREPAKSGKYLDVTGI